MYVGLMGPGSHARLQNVELHEVFNTVRLQRWPWRKHEITSTSRSSWALASSGRGRTDECGMGFSNVTGKTRPKRPGCETKSQRDKRKKRVNDEEKVEELRVVKKQPGAKGGERRPEQLKKQKNSWEKKMLALMKTNDAIKVLQARQGAGETLDSQQLAKLERADEILLSLDSLIEERPKEAEALMAARTQTAEARKKAAALEARESALALASEAAR